ncbi:hypothetical protein SK128_013510 [Halocaridina rubra]|uniref:Uncharacterized protein n=1 Tax=Halocaridina rubra TaxID=373956 RepID=A0AAN8WHL3_HALRR
MFSMKNLTLFAIAVVAVFAAPHENYDEEQVTKMIEMHFCTDGTENCVEKVKSCHQTMEPASEEMKKALRDEWTKNFELCQKKEGVVFDWKAAEPPNAEDMSRVLKCTSEAIGITIDGKLNRDLFRKELKENTADNSASSSVQSAILKAVEDCPEATIDIYHNCLVKACVAVM